MAAKNSLPNTADADVSERAEARSLETSTLPIVIRKRPDFLAANRGKRFVTPGFVLLVHKRRQDHPVSSETIRYGITVTKKIGNAVIRNRMKRRFRALVANSLAEHGLAGADHILIGRKQNQEPDFAIMQRELEKGLRYLSKKLA